VPGSLFVRISDDPQCVGGSGSLSGFTFLNFMMSAIALGANIVSNINSNQRNNNNNNNDNNDNVNNFNFASNNNAGNNQVLFIKRFFLGNCDIWSGMNYSVYFKSN
jgi:hypothetical protein